MATVRVVLVSTTVAETAVQPGVLTVQRKVAGDVVTVTPVVGEPCVVIVAAPLTTLHDPVLNDGAGVAFIIKEDELQLLLLVPADVETGQFVWAMLVIP